MRGLRAGLVLSLVAGVVVASARWSLQAQERNNASGNGVAKTSLPDRAEVKVPADRADGASSVQDALERPFIFPFNEPTRLEEACRHLGRILNAPVVLDRAALDRLGIRADDPVQLELHGVRLKTGLKLLLDQVGMTYHVVPEDNLLILTDAQGAEDPLHLVLAELKALHRDLHHVQDEVEQLRDALTVEEEGPKMRKPTIIEEMPADPAEKKAPAEPDAEPKPAPSRRRS